MLSVSSCPAQKSLSLMAMPVGSIILPLSGFGAGAVARLIDAEAKPVTADSQNRRGRPLH
jgi:hypothetical protein